MQTLSGLILSILMQQNNHFMCKQFHLQTYLVLFYLSLCNRRTILCANSPICRLYLVLFYLHLRTRRTILCANSPIWRLCLAISINIYATQEPFYVQLVPFEDFAWFIPSILMQQKNCFASNLSSSGHCIIGLLFTNEQQQKIGSWYFCATHTNLVHDVTDTGCHTQNGSAHRNVYKFQLLISNKPDQKSTEKLFWDCCFFVVVVWLFNFLILPGLKTYLFNLKDYD